MRQIRREVRPPRAAQERYRGPNAEEERARRPVAVAVLIEAEEGHSRRIELDRADLVREAYPDDRQEGTRAELGVLMPLPLLGERVGVLSGLAQGERDAEPRRRRELAARGAEPEHKPRIGRSNERLIVVVDVVGDQLRPPIELAV